MAKSARRLRQARADEAAAAAAEATAEVRAPWMAWRSGLVVITLASLALAIFTGWQIYPVGGLREALLWGGGAGLSIWVIFFLSYRFNAWLRPR